MVSLFYHLSHDIKRNRVVLGNVVRRAHEKRETVQPHDKSRTVESKLLAHTREIKGNKVGPISKVHSQKDGDVTVQT